MAKLCYGASPTSVILRVKLMNSSVTTGAGLTGLSEATVGLFINTIKNNESSGVYYTTPGTIETITTLGTYAAPTATKCRFKEINSTYFPGVYEIQLANARLNGCDSLIMSINGAANLAQADFEVQTNLLADGTAGTASFKNLSIVNNAGNAILASSTGGNGTGINALGNGTGPGIYAAGGVSAPAVWANANTSGIGCLLVGSTVGEALKISGLAASYPAVSITSPNTGAAPEGGAVLIRSTAGNALVLDCDHGDTGTALYLEGAGAGYGLGVFSNDGDAISIISTNERGISINSLLDGIDITSTSGNALDLNGGAAFKDIDAKEINALPTIATIVASGNINSWNAVTSTTGLALTTDVTTARDVIIASGNSAWITATGFATPTNVSTTESNLSGLIVARPTIATIVASGNAEGWNAVTSTTGLATQTDVTSARDTIIASGNAYWETDTLESRLTSARAGYLDNLNIGTYVSSSGQVAALPTIATIVASGNAEGWDATSTLSVGAIVSGVWEHTIDIVNAEDAIQYILAYTTGNTSRSGTTYTYKAQNGTVGLVEIEGFDTGRVVTKL